MSKILRNDTGSEITIDDTGVTVSVGAANQYTIPAQEYLLWATSNDVITEIGAGNIVVNDGSSDLDISEGVDLIKGLFPKEIQLMDNSSGFSAEITEDGKIKTEAVPSEDAKTDNLEIICLLNDIYKQLKIMNQHMESITDLENLELESGNEDL